MSDIPADHAPRRGADHARGEGAPLVAYRLIAKILHWATAILVIAMIAFGVTMTQLGGGPVADALVSAHKLTGVLILALVVLRLVYRVASRSTKQWRSELGDRRVRAILYGFLLATPLLGWAGVSDFGAREAFGLTLPAIWPEGLGWSDRLLTAHAIAAFTMLALVCVHIGLALHNYVMRGSDVER